VRRVLLLNALIFAVLAAAVALAYYSYSYTSEDNSRERELALMRELANEKVLNIESLITDADRKLLRDVQIDPVSDLQAHLPALVRSSGAAVENLWVLDAEKNLIPGSPSTMRERKTGVDATAYFMKSVLPKLDLDKAKLDELASNYLRESKPGQPPGRWYLFSYMRRMVNGKTFYIVMQDDLTYLQIGLFSQFFQFSSNARRLYQVVDENDSFVYGTPFASSPNDLVVEREFLLTGWKLRVTQKDVADEAAMERKRLINSLLIGGAVTIILVGLGVLVFAIRRERRLSELKSEFISNVSHELKTPLSIISMFGEMLAEGRTKSPEQAHEYAEIIWRESVRLGRLIDNVLDFAKIERGMGVYEFAETDLGEVVDRAVELSQRRVLAAEMTLETDIASPEDLPLVELDANAFTLAVLNLIDNAIKYAHEGKKIRLTLQREGDTIVLRVQDWGPGIELVEQDRIFERFYRAKAIRLKPIRGSGIGLALVQHIAQAHGGKVSVESKVGAGATFSMTIPVGGKN
jgi:two-component system phosphate regulon sensor histidine kinase PhoR